MIEQSKRKIISENFDTAGKQVQHIEDIVEYNADSLSANDVLYLMVEIPSLIEKIVSLQKKLAICMNKKLMKDLFKEAS